MNATPETDVEQFANPVISGFYPDPSICRVGEDFYLITSSFEYFPGIPVFHSRDLVTWTQLGHVLDRVGQLDLAGARASGGIFAPTLRHHEGMFYVAGTNTSGRGNFIVHSRDPAGPWSDPVWVDQDGIDPSLFFEDGNVYFSSTVEPDVSLPHQAEPDFTRGIQQCLLDPLSGEKLSSSRFVWEGTGGMFPEAPHLLRRNGYYYLILAEGGTEYGHMVTVGRSDSPWGPFQSESDVPFLSHRSSSSPIQAVGHADLVELRDGSWWAVCLGIRPVGYPRCHVLGRETFLVEVEWTPEGWPRVAGTGRVELEAARPNLETSSVPEREGKDDFDGPALGPTWNHLRTPKPSSWSLDQRPGWFVQRGTPENTDSPNLLFLGRRQQHWVCSIRARLEFTPTHAGDEAGLTVRMNESHHYDLAIQHADGQRYAILRCRVGSLLASGGRVAIDDGPIELSVHGSAQNYRFGVMVNGKHSTVGEPDTRYLATEVAGGFTGVYVGMFCTAQSPTTEAHWDWFDYQPESDPLRS